MIDDATIKMAISKPILIGENHNFAGHNFRISPLPPSKILTLDTPDPVAPCVFGPVANNTSAGFRSLINHHSGDILLGVPLLDMMSRKCEMTPNWVQLVGCSERLC